MTFFKFWDGKKLRKSALVVINATNDFIFTLIFNVSLAAISMENINRTQAGNSSKIYTINSSFAETYYEFSENLFEIGGSCGSACFIYREFSKSK